MSRVEPGKVFGQLTAIEPAGKAADGHTLWKCHCSCGNTKSVATNNLGRTTFSCRIGDCHPGYRSRKHGHTVGIKGATMMSPTYGSWRAMIQRCTNPNNNRFGEYGARDITVCESWRKFSGFLSDMGERPDGCTIDRVDVNGNYTKENCRWATSVEQAMNKRRAA